MTCTGCRREPTLPYAESSVRRCAFFEDGTFNPDNWRCATVDALERLVDRAYVEDGTVFGFDESLQLVPVRYVNETGFTTSRGWLVLTRYKTRGKLSSAAWVGDFWFPESLTLQIAEAVLAGRDPQEVAG